MPKSELAYTVLRDTSEQKGWTFDYGERCLGTVPKNLYTGDYSIDGYYDNKRFVIERKGAVAELVNNLTAKEKWEDFRNELERLEEFEHPFVICEFPLRLIEIYPEESGLPWEVRRKIKVRPRFLLMRLEEIWIRFKTKWIFAGSPGLARDVASGLFKRVVENVRP